MGNFISWGNDATTAGDSSDGVNFSLIEESISFNQDLGIKPRSTITRIRAIAKPEAIALELEFDDRTNERTRKRIDYSSHERGCLMEWSQESSRILVNKDYAEAFFENFGLILRIQKSILDAFEIEFRPGSLNTVEQMQNHEIVISHFLKNVKAVLEERPRPLQVKYFAMKQFEKTQFQNVLPFIDAEKIQKIVISDAKERYQKLAVELLEKLEQWKRAHEVGVMYFDMTIPTQNFGSFDTVTLALKTISTEMFRQLKEAFEAARHMKYFEIKYKTFVVDTFLGASRPPAIRRTADDFERIDTFQHFVFLFGQPSISSNPHEKKWIFSIQDTNETYEIKLRPSFIMFERVEIKEAETGFFAGIMSYFY